MPAETDRWEERWSSPGHWAGEEPAAFLREVLPFLPHGLAVDVAVGGGRNSVFLVESGWHVTGIDKSAAALEKSVQLAQPKGIAVTHSAAKSSAKQSHNSLELICADLESAPLPRSRYDVVLCFNFLLRPITAAIQNTLRPGGMLVFETYTLDQLKFSDGPRNPNYLLRPGELRDMFSGLDVLFHREVSSGRGIASLLARK